MRSREEQEELGSDLTERSEVNLLSFGTKLKSACMAQLASKGGVG
jgi:hypothetical protein